MGVERSYTSNNEKESRDNRGCGCATPSSVLVVGLALSLLKANLGIGISARIPFTDSNMTLAGSVGAKSLSIATLPEYVEGKFGDNENFINQSESLTIGPAEGVGLFVIGHQEGSSIFDIHIDAARK